MSDWDKTDASRSMRMILFNHDRTAKLTVRIKDKDGDSIEIYDLVSQVTDYLNEELKGKESNHINDQLYPLVTDILSSGLSKLIGVRNAAFILTDEVTKISLTHMMMTSILILKFIQENDLVIYTEEEPISPEEVSKIDRHSKATGVLAAGGVAGMSPREILKELVSAGVLTLEEVAEITKEELTGEDDGKQN